MVNPIALAVPFFLALMGLELWACSRRGLQHYRFADAINDLSCGMAQQSAMLVLKVALLAIYTAGYGRFHLFNLPASSPWTWLLAIVAIDFTYYWWHRLSHEVNFLWAAHVTHHSSEDYNLAVALRQSAFTPLTVMPFHLVLVLLGIPPLVLFAGDAIVTLYQFWIHTQLIDRIGRRAEAVLNTPSHHRVHHAVNPQYLDRNYAGMLIIWDRMFGTFEPEREPVVFGLVKPLARFDPLWAQVHRMVELVALARATPRWSDKLRVFLRPPPWTPPGVTPYPAPQAVSRQTHRKHELEVPRRIQVYVLFHVGLVVVALTWLLWYEASLGLRVGAAAAALLWLTLGSFGALMERRHEAAGLEAVRLLLVGIAAAVIAARAGLPRPMAAGVLVLTWVPQWIWVRQILGTASPLEGAKAV